MEFWYIKMDLLLYRVVIKHQDCFVYSLVSLIRQIDKVYQLGAKPISLIVCE